MDAREFIAVAFMWIIVGAVVGTICALCYRSDEEWRKFREQCARDAGVVVADACLNPTIVLRRRP